jgi:hypothetical protein
MSLLSHRLFTLALTPAEQAKLRADGMMRDVPGATIPPPHAKAGALILPNKKRDGLGLPPGAQKLPRSEGAGPLAAKTAKEKSP